MNRWQCQHPGCKSEAVGTGGAIGLRAIGWYFERGPVILCPVHQPHTVLCKDIDHPMLCSLCGSDEVAQKWQHIIEVIG